MTLQTEINQIPRYNAKNLCQWQPYDPEHDHWVVTQVVGRYAACKEHYTETIFEDYGIMPRDNSMRTTPEQALANTRALELNQASFTEHLAGRMFDRFLTSSYVAVSVDEAKRHAEIDRTHPDKVRITRGVSILHYAGSWALWSDGKFTTGIGVDLPRGGVLSPAAQGLISTLRGSDSGSVNLPGGMLALTKLAAILSEETYEYAGNRGHYAGQRIEQLHVRWQDGAEGDLFAVSEGYFEGYAYDIYASLDDAVRNKFSTPVTGVTTFPADDYGCDPVLGYMKKED